ncbi:MAG: hypothetical protein E6G90_01465 [Alphaproteobacteria bacterium]|nr:MAG: hypothetical protein E6G90_01465 [Alphaproteobacteria bacterium]
MTEICAERLIVVTFAERPDLRCATTRGARSITAMATSADISIMGWSPSIPPSPTGRWLIGRGYRRPLGRAFAVP